MFTTTAEIKTMIITLEMHYFEYPNNKLNFCDKSICYTRVLKLGITYQIMLKVVKT